MPPLFLESLDLTPSRRLDDGDGFLKTWLELWQAVAPQCRAGTSAR